jgi:hypothetical protein
MLDTITYARREACPIVFLHHHHHLLHRTLSLHILSQISSLSRSDHVENNSFHTWHMKLSFHQVFIHPNGLRSSELCPFYSGATICPKVISNCTSLNVFTISPCTGLQIHRSFFFDNQFIDLGCVGTGTDGASDFQLFIPSTCRTRSSKLMKTATFVFEVR